MSRLFSRTGLRACLFLFFNVTITSHSLANDSGISSETSSNSSNGSFEEKKSSSSSTSNDSHSQIAKLPLIEITDESTISPHVDTQQLLTSPGSGNDPMRAIYSLPGVTFDNDFGGLPAIRGSSPLDNAYEMDGFPVEYLFHYDSSSIMNEHLVEDFTLHPSAFSHRFQDATGAAIEVHSRAPQRGKLKTTWDASILRAGILVESSLNERDALFFSARQSLLFLFAEELIDNDELEFRTFPKYYDYQGKFFRQYDNGDTLTVQISGAEDEAEIFVPEDSDIVTEDPDLQGKVSSSSQYHQQGFVLNQLSEKGDESTLVVNHLYSDFDSTIGQAGDVYGFEHQFLLRNTQKQTWDLNHDWLYTWSYLLKSIEYDLDFKNAGCTDIEPGCLISQAERQKAKDDVMIHHLDFLVEDHWALSPQWSLVSGLHLDYDNYLQDLFLEPRFNLQFSPSSSLDYHWAYGRYHRFPRGQEIIQIIDTFGNPNLKQSTADHFEIGFVKNLNSGWTISSDIYYKILNDLVISDEQTQYSNDASGESYGLELLLNKSLTEKWQGWLSLSLSKTERTNNRTGETFQYEYDRPLILNLISSYQLNSRLKLGAKWRYQSGGLVTPVIGSQLSADETYYIPIYGEPFSERLDHYNRLDLRLDYFIKPQTGLKMYLEVINALNRNNPSGYDYSPDYSNREEVYHLPMIPSVGIQGSF